MKEKKKSDNVLAETPEAPKASSTRKKGEAPADSFESYKSDVHIDLCELIARRAYELYEERGRRHGDDIHDWLRAEAEVKSTLRPEKRRSVTSRARAGQ